jgi:GTP-binding protein YchF
VGRIIVPDDRLYALASLVAPEDVIHAVVDIVDIAGLVKGASRGEGLGNKFLSHIREADAIIHVLRCFDDDNIIHVDGTVDPVRDKETLDTELQLKDLETVEARLAREEKRAKAGGDAHAKVLVEVLQLYREHLLRGESARAVKLDKARQEVANELMLLTNKPVLYVCNIDENTVENDNQHVKAVKKAVKKEEASVLKICIGVEATISELEWPEERTMFLQELGLEKAGTDQLIRAAYDLLKLRTYFTAGPKEVRAWTFREGMKAPQAAGIIHSDFEKGFIRAEVIKFNDYIELGSEAKCKEAGKMSVEGKEYVVKDGDVMHFRVNT